MSNSRKKTILAIGVVLMSLLICPKDTKAFEIKVYDNMPVEGDIVLGPGKTELFLAPGESVTRELKITNRTGAPMTIDLDIEDFVGDETYSTKLLGEEKGPYSLKDYVKPEKNNFVLAHGERAILPVTIEIPNDANPGGLYGAVILRMHPANEEAEGNGSVSIISRISSLFFVRVKGDIAEDGFLKEFSTEKKFYKEGPINFSINYQNNGSVHLNPYATIEIKNILGKKIDSIDVAPWFVMPGFSRNRTIAWDKKLAFGRYTATVSLDRGYQGITDEASVDFWIIPLKALVIAGSIILIISIFIWWFSSKFELKKK